MGEISTTEKVVKSKGVFEPFIERIERFGAIRVGVMLYDVMFDIGLGSWVTELFREIPIRKLLGVQEGEGGTIGRE